MDGDYAAVRFPSSKDGAKDSAKEGLAGGVVGAAEDAGLLLQDCRLMRTDDLQVRSLYLLMELVNLS